MRAYRGSASRTSGSAAPAATRGYRTATPFLAPMGRFVVESRVPTKLPRLALNETMVTASPARTWMPYASRRAYAYPAHNVLGLPALSPTMTHGTLATWEKKEGDKVNVGDVIADVDTDKATMAWESVDEGYVAKLLVKKGTSEVKVGTPAIVLVENKEDVEKFADYTPEAKASGAAEPAPKKAATEPAPAAAAPAPKKAAAPAKKANLPSHNQLGLPSLSPTMEKGVLQKWNKKVGDKVSAGDILASVETDKATMDWESVDEGYVAKLLVTPGTGGLTVGTPVLVLVDNAEDVAAFKDYEPSTGGAEEKEEAAPKKEEAAPSKPQAAAAAAPSKPQTSTAAGSSDRVSASPYARKVAQEKGVDLSQLQGTGPNGRVIAADVLEYKPSAQPAAAKATTAAAQPAAARPAAAAAAAGNYTDIPNSSIRKVIARRLTESKQTIPHYYLTIECRVDKLLKLREEFNQKSEGKYKLSVNDFIIKASAMALKKTPAVNSSWNEEFIRRYNNVDINVAVNTPEGLFTPIVPEVDRKGLVAISETVKQLAAKAKDKKLTPQDYDGGTFTISNLGMFGINQFAAVINPPQAAILAVGSTTKRLVTNNDIATSKTRPYEEANYLTVTLSCDHRVVDGAVGAEWLQHFRGYMEDPLRMLL